MSGQEERIANEIKPCIEKMVMDITRQKPKDIVYQNISNLILPNNYKYYRLNL